MVLSGGLLRFSDWVKMTKVSNLPNYG